MQERGRRGLGLVRPEQLDVPSRLLLGVADAPQVPVVLDAHLSLLEALREVSRKMLRDLLVQATFEAVLGPVAEDSQGVEGDGSPVTCVAGEVGLEQVERLSPGAAREGAKLIDVR